MRATMPRNPRRRFADLNRNIPAKWQTDPSFDAGPTHDRGRMMDTVASKARAYGRWGAILNAVCFIGMAALLLILFFVVL